MSETSAMLADAIERIAADLCPPATVRAAEEGAWPDALWRAIAEAGLDRATAPEAGGGSGLGWSDALALAEACGRHALPVPLAESLGAHALAALGGLAVPPGAATFAALEARGGELLAREAPFASRCEWVVGFEDGDANRPARVRVLPVGGGAPSAGRNVAGEERSSLVWRSSAGVATGDLPADQSGLAVGAALRTAQIAGAVERLLDMSVRYANDRVQFGKPIGRFQAIQQQLAVLAEIAAQSRIAARLAFEGDGLALDRVRVACAKQVTSTGADQAAAIAHAVHGAIGVTAEYDLQLFTRRLRAWRGEFGSAHAWALELGRRALGRGSPSLWHDVVEAST